MTDTDWNLVCGRKKKEDEQENEMPKKINEPCWFYNNAGGCRHKDGTIKTDKECKYLHIYMENVNRPSHLNVKKPCDKFNLEGDCIWHNNCKYSHKSLSQDEWTRYYPSIPYPFRTNRLPIEPHTNEIENKISNIEGRLNVLEFKQDGMYNDLQQLHNTLQAIMQKLY